MKQTGMSMLFEATNPTDVGIIFNTASWPEGYCVNHDGVPL
jgi:hypothetical protein